MYQNMLQIEMIFLLKELWTQRTGIDQEGKEGVKEQPYRKGRA